MDKFKIILLTTTNNHNVAEDLGWVLTEQSTRQFLCVSFVRSSLKVEWNIMQYSQLFKPVHQFIKSEKYEDCSYNSTLKYLWQFRSPFHKDDFPFSANMCCKESLNSWELPGEDIPAMALDYVFNAICLHRCEQVAHIPELSKWRNNQKGGKAVRCKWLFALCFPCDQSDWSIQGGKAESSYANWSRLTCEWNWFSWTSSQ